MMTGLSITDSNISVAWAKAFLTLMDNGKKVRHPALVTIEVPDAAISVEHNAIRSLLDRELKKHGKNSCETVASTIFPMSMWNPSLSNDAEALFKRYDKAWPGIKKCPQNRIGVYFRRLTAYQPNGSSGKPVNQLDFIVRNYLNGNHRKSAMQASILDPTRDHTTNRVKGFPCMQQVAFTPLGDDRLSITGYYATQYQFEKAYGNYLGLYNLGQFMAKQLGMKLKQVVCLASVLDRGEAPKHDLETLATSLTKLI